MSRGAIGPVRVNACSWSGSVGRPLVQRFSADALAQAGVRWIVILEGVNGIGNCPAGNGHALARKWGGGTVGRAPTRLVALPVA